MALRPGLILCNPGRLNDDTLPPILKQWEVIYSPPMENTDRHDADYISKSIGSDWIDMNVFSINPNLVVVDRNQPSLIKLLEKHGLDVIPLKLRHSKLLGGGPHCVTLDIRRTGHAAAILRLSATGQCSVDGRFDAWRARSPDTSRVRNFGAWEEEFWRSQLPSWRSSLF